jgi:hypothetical protein
MPRLCKSEAKKQAECLLKEVLGLVDKLEYVRPVVGRILFRRLAEAYASANFGYEGFEGAGRTMLNLDEADIVYAVLERVARNLGESFEQLADRDRLQEWFIDIEAGETAQSRADRMWNNHHDKPGWAISTARVMKMHSTYKPAKLWWGNVVRILEQRKAEHEPHAK